ncbi:hypothetical protein E2C01_002381 [Portunus trituberculatus]|uniref:Uncharacterized protein n=1 Tax=Portunus trituberculatus TaxID=210409 RepID=A0A5B7CQK3_PORTR|nr:hypothetical protein [Portunus trituberculatus]
MAHSVLHTTPSHCHEVNPLTPKELPSSYQCLVHDVQYSVPSFMASCSARCHHKPETQTVRQYADGGSGDSGGRGGGRDGSGEVR